MGTCFAHGILLLLILAVISSGCASGHYGSLKSELDIEGLAPLASAADQLVGTKRVVTTAVFDQREIHLAMEEVGTGPPDRLIVMLHGFLSDRRTWRFVAADLAPDHRMLLVDLLGCGESDRPDPRWVGARGYSTDAQAMHLLQALRSYLDGLAYSPRITLVGHSYGGAVALRVLGDDSLLREYGDVVELIDQAVLMAPLDFSLEKADPKFVKLSRLSDSKIKLAAAAGMLKQAMARTATNGTSTPGRLPREDVDRAIEILRNRDSRRAAQAMIQQALPFDLVSQRPDWERVEQLVADYKNVAVPTLILWGARDETLSASMGYKLQSQLPNARLRVIERSMHSLPLERPDVSAGLIRAFANGEGTAWSRVESINPESWEDQCSPGCDVPPSAEYPAILAMVGGV
ncbi:MAG: alpha/beta fold hydrolase [Nitrospirae bacterium]|nr:alpha/beta fold hydrolase [Nitrospirota bacterium]